MHMATVIAQGSGYPVVRDSRFATIVRRTCLRSSVRLEGGGRMAEIEIIVSPDGTVTVEAMGVVGPGCQDLTRAIEDALGTVESRQCKVEYYESVAEGEQLSQRGG